MLFRYRLARHFQCSVRDLDNRIPASEMPYWIAHYAIEPFGFEMHDLISSRSAALTANAANQFRTKIKLTEVMFKSTREDDV